MEIAEWGFLYFQNPRYGHDTNNITESVNGLWDEIRNLPPLQMLQAIHLWMMKTFYDRSQTKQLPGNQYLSNTAFTGYQDRLAYAQSCKVQPYSQFKFVVTTPNRHTRIVDLPSEPQERAKSNTVACTCMMWYEYESPCAHAIAAILYAGKEPISWKPGENPYMIWYYTREAYRKCYEKPIEPVLLEGLSRDSNIAPPFKKRLAGRPVVKRLRAKYVQRAQKRCGNCRQYGHYKNKCRNQPVENGRRQRAYEGGDESDMAEDSEFELQSQVEPNSDDSGAEPEPPTDSELADYSDDDAVVISDPPSDDEQARATWENRRIAAALAHKEKELDAREAQLRAMGIDQTIKKGKKAPFKKATPKRTPKMTPKAPRKKATAKRKGKTTAIVGDSDLPDSDDSTLSQTTQSVNRFIRKNRAELKARLKKVAQREAAREGRGPVPVPEDAPASTQNLPASDVSRRTRHVPVPGPDTPPRRVRRLSEITTPSPAPARQQQQEQRSPTRNRPIRERKRVRMAPPPQEKCERIGDSDPETSGLGRGDRDSDGGWVGT